MYWRRIRRRKAVEASWLPQDFGLVIVKVAKDFGATYTPEFFVFNKDRKLVYKGGMDDDSNAAKVKTNYLEPAIQAAFDVSALRSSSRCGTRA